MRKVLHMATVAAVRVNRVIQASYQRLLVAGKTKKLALVAYMRKLLVILNAMLKYGTLWSPYPLGLDTPHSCSPSLLKESTVRSTRPRASPALHR